MLSIRPFTRNEAFSIQNIIQTAYIDVQNHNVADVVVVHADRDPLVHFKSPVTYSKTGYLFGPFQEKKPSLSQIAFELHMLMLPTTIVMLLFCRC